MLNEVLRDGEFNAIMKNHTKDLIRYLLEKDLEFGVLAKSEYLEFNPKLPKEITKSFGEFVMFIIANYTLESAYIEGDNFIFEAGFGSENIESVVTVPIESIFQITIDNNPIFVNLSATIKKEIKDSSVKNSMEALLSNPENLKLLKKKKK